MFDTEMNLKVCDSRTRPDSGFKFEILFHVNVNFVCVSCFPSHAILNVVLGVCFMFP